jgi:hypothetical protein
VREFKRERRYIVLKLKDLECLNSHEMIQLDAICAKVEMDRLSNGKDELKGVFVESDWPEHDGVWASIAIRMSPEKPPLQVELEQIAEYGSNGQQPTMEEE